MLILTGCSSNVKPLEVKVSPVKQVNLQLPDVNKITLDPIDWYVVNKNNVEDVFKELEKKKYDNFIIEYNTGKDKKILQEKYKLAGWQSGHQILFMTAIDILNDNIFFGNGIKPNPFCPILQPS